MRMVLTIRRLGVNVSGKGSKQLRRAHQRTKPTIAEAMKPLRVSVITIPATGQYGPVLHQDVRLVKAALLYADEVELISPGAVMIGSFAALADGGLPAMLQVFASLDRSTLALLFGERGVPPNLDDILEALPFLLDQNVAELIGFGESQSP